MTVSSESVVGAAGIVSFIKIPDTILNIDISYLIALSPNQVPNLQVRLLLVDSNEIFCSPECPAEKFGILKKFPSKILSTLRSVD